MLPTYVENRIKDLKAMHKAMLEIADEEYYMTWIVCGVPDEPSEDDFEYIAEDDPLFSDVLKEFARLLTILRNEDLKEWERVFKLYVAESLK